MNPDDFRSILRNRPAEDIVNDFIVSDYTGLYTSREELKFIEESIKEKFKINEKSNITTIIVGSAKLGFALHKKRLQDGSLKPAFRPYVPGESDIDVAIVCPSLYTIIWKDLARHGSQQNKFPWITKLGHYMFHGWIRPDQFPNPSPASCNDWKELFREINRKEPYRFKKFRYAIYASDLYLTLYHIRGIKLAKAAEELS